jgi:tryptophan synthase alpha chain
MTQIMTHIVAGYPTLKESEQIAQTMLQSGVDYLEIQIPFSDPIGDGPIIMQANQQAIHNGTTIEDCFKLMKKLKNQTDTPLLFMTYYNIPFSYGLENFCKKNKESGAYGLIIPDIPIDEEPNEHYLATCKKYNLHPIQVLSPITPEERIKKICKKASGFIYCTARTGTTGSDSKLNQSTTTYLNTVRKHTDLPLAIGFGISSKDQIVQAHKIADIAVIGSHLMKTYQQKDLTGVKDFISSIPKE